MAVVEALKYVEVNQQIQTGFFKYKTPQHILREYQFIKEIIIIHLNV